MKCDTGKSLKQNAAALLPENVTPIGALAPLHEARLRMVVATTALCKVCGGCKMADEVTTPPPR